MTDYLQLASLLELAAKQLRSAHEQLSKIPKADDDKPIASLPGYDLLTLRCRRAITRDEGPDFNGFPIIRIRDLEIQTKDDLLCRRNFGHTSLAEIGRFLKKNGLSLRDGFPY